MWYIFRGQVRFGQSIPVAEKIFFAFGDVSAALANLSAFPLDLRLSGMARSFGAQYTRYADDLTFSATNDFSVSFWLRYSQMNGEFPLVANRDWSGANNSGWGIAVGAGGQLRWRALDLSGSILRRRRIPIAGRLRMHDVSSMNWNKPGHHL